MKPSEFTPPSGATGRADLLRALALAPREYLTLDADGESWFGYVKRPQPSSEHDSIRIHLPALTAKVRDTESGYKLPLRMPFVHVIAERLPRQQPAGDEQTLIAEVHAEPIDEDSAKAPSDKRLVGYEDLVPQARLLPALRRQLSAIRAGSLDLNRLIRCLAAGEMPRHLPRRRLQRWHPELVVVLDFCQRLWPYREDMHRLAERLLHHCGRSGLSLRIVNHGPFGPWSDWLAHQDRHAIKEPPERTWKMPPAGTPVLIVSDLGLLLGAQSGPGRAWQDFIAKLVKAQLRPAALLPLGTRQLDGALPPSLSILRWSLDARARPERARGSGQPAPEGLEELLAMAAVTRRLDPPLLRSLRRINPRAPLNAGLEGALWCHADVEAGASASIRSEAQEAHLRRFAEHLKDIHAALEALRHTHHAHLRAALNHEESLLWRTHAKVDGNDLSAETRQRMTEAEAFMAKLAATLQPPDSLKSAGVWWSVAQGIVRRADMALGEHYGRLLTPLVAALARQGSSPPDWVDPAILASLLDDEQGPLRCWLVRDAATGCLLLQAEPAGARQSPLGEPLVLDAGGARLRVGEGVGAFRRWLSTRDLPMALAPLSEPMPLHLVTAREAITIAAVKRPPGVLGWSCDRAGISVNGAQLGDHEAHWAGENLRTVGLGDESEDRSWALEAAENWDTSLGGNASARFGLDGKHGLYADVRFVAPHGSVAQRFRWIEPGTFWMGSPDDEHERSDNEGPRHAVTLTRGFWLADTACTQALWQAVMGSNSSQFTGDPQRPVEWVSWHDVQGFLRKLEALVPGCRADLPTEAEWEYACRAGTDTPFSFGVQITPEQVNYNGNYPYAGGEKGVYREQTVPVKSLPPNAWGLYEMHGNVWEWCADGLRTYDGKPQQDPIGPILEGEEAPRAFRGGSWLDDAWWARSACRRAHLPGLASLAQGFRLCLRSIEIGRVPGRPGGTAGLASGGSQSLSTPPREEARLLERLKRAFRSGGKKKR